MGMNRCHLLCNYIYVHRVDAGHLGSQWLGAVGDAQGFLNTFVQWSEQGSPKQSSGTWDILGYRILISGMIMVSNPL